jgi:hypothetical protein
MLLQAYVDDSGNTPQGKDAHQDRFVLAGFVMAAEKWELFSDRWAAALSRPPKIEYFKMNAVEDGGKPFITESGLILAREFRLQKMNEVAQVIAELEPLPVVASLKWDDYERMVRGKVHPKLDSPYAILFYQIQRAAHEFQIAVNKMFPERNFGFHRVDFVFDKQGPVGEQASQWHAKLAQVVPEPYKTMMGNTPVFRDDRDIVALQAADMLAWHVRHGYAYPRDMMPALERILPEGSTINEVGERALHQFVELSQRADRDELERGF